MNVDLETIRTVMTIIAVGITIYLAFTSRSKKNSEQLTDHDERILKLELELNHLPTKEGQHEMKVAITQLAGDVKQISEKLDITRKTVIRMEEAMMSGGSK